jgi:hypothetical protein
MITLELDINRKDILFCSQPLIEDGRGIDQFVLLENVLKVSTSMHNRVFLKRHPREYRELPDHIKSHEKLTIFNDDINQALKKFHTWYGFNSMALYAAKELGHNVTFLDKNQLG